MRWGIAGLLSCLVGACSSGPGEQRCIPGESRACAGGGGCDGFRVCSDDGASLGVCECASVDAGGPGPSPSDAGSGDASPADASEPLDVCVARACSADRSACLAQDSCYSLGQCLEECATEECSARCVERHSKDEAYRDTTETFRRYAACAEAACGGVLELDRADITSCAHTRCRATLDPCLARSGCDHLQTKLGCCEAFAEDGYVSFDSYPDCRTGTIDNYRRWARGDAAEKEGDIDTLGPYLECVARECGDGVLKSTSNAGCSP